MNYLTTEEKMQGLNKQKIQRHALIIQKKLMTFMKNQKGYNPTKKIKMVIVSDDMIADMEANKILKAIASE